MNHQVDIIVIGDSKCGNEAVKQLASYKPSLKIIFVSSIFKSNTTRDFLNVEYIRNTVVFTDYKNRLFGCYLENGDRLYSTHLIIATGLKYKPFLVNNKQVPCVFNTVEELPKYSRDLPAVVLCDDNAEVKFTLAVAKKFKHIYLCTKASNISNITPANLKKLSQAENIVMLPNTIITKFSTENGELKTVELSNYSNVTCSAVFVKTEAHPDVDSISEKLITKNEEGFLVTDSKAESTLVPKCYAIGNCCVKSTKKMQQQMIESIKNDFKGEF